MKMSSDEITPEPQPAWLEPDDEEKLTPVALRPLYGKLPQHVTQALESARRAIRDGYVRGVLDAHAALAGRTEVTFKDWCLAVGINYNSAKSVVHRAEADKRGATVPRLSATPGPDDDDAGPDDTPDDDAPDDDAPDDAGGGDDDDDDDDDGAGKPKPDAPPPPKPEGKPKKEPTLKFTFADADEQKRLWKSIERVMEARKLDHEAALQYIVDVFDGRVEMLASDAARIVQATEGTAAA